MAKKKKIKVRKMEMKEGDGVIHLRDNTVDTVIGKIITAGDVQEKLKFARYLMQLCNALPSNSQIIKNHLAVCTNCKDYLDSRKLLANLIVKGGKV